MKIAFKGNYNRGIEIINLLKLFGGINRSDLIQGNNPNLYYFISNSGLIDCLPKYRLREYKLYSIENFPLVFNTTIHIEEWIGKINMAINFNNQLITF